MTRLMLVKESPWRTFSLYLLMVAGVLAHWFWVLGWEFLREPHEPLLFGSPLSIAIRVLLAFIAAALTFVPTYNKISQGEGLSWVPYFLAFQNGFFWEAAMDAVVRQF
jgi:hypothetical protein